MRPSGWPRLCKNSEAVMPAGSSRGPLCDRTILRSRSAAMTSVLQQITEVATIIIALALVGADRVHRDSDRRGASGTRTSTDPPAPRADPRRRRGDHSQREPSERERQLRHDGDTQRRRQDERDARIERTSGCSTRWRLTEQQLSDFNALLTVVREEAEHLFVSTASTVRGVQQGAAGRFGVVVGWTLRLTSSMRPRRPTT